jgi:hypothetical protein
VSQLQAVDRPVQRSALSTFLSDVLPEVTQAVQKEQEQDRAYNIALGRNDELNGVQRAVNLLDSKYYNMGHEFQKVNSTQMQQDKDFNTQVDELIAQGASADDIWEHGRKYLANSVDMVYQSDLDSDVKEQMYDADLKRQIAYQKVIADKIQSATEQRFVFDRTNRVASLFTDLSTSDSVEAMDLKTEAYIQKAQLAYVNVGGMKPDEAVKAVEQDLISAAKFWQTRLQDPTAQNAGTALQLKAFVDRGVKAGYMPMGVALELNSGANTIESNIMDHNGLIAEKDVEQNTYKWDTDPDTYDIGKVQDGIDSIQKYVNSGDITPEKGLQLQKRYMDYASRRQEKLLSAKDDMTPADMINAGITQQQWVGMLGNSEDSYIKGYEQYILNRFPNDTTTAGLAMYNQAITGDPSGYALRPLAVKAGTWLSGNVLSTISMSDSDLQNSENGKQRLAQYQQLQSAFQATLKTKPDMADALLEGFPADKREIVRRALLQGRTIGDLRNDLGNAPKITEQRSFAASAIKAMKFDDLKGGFLSNLIGNNPSGVRTSFLSQQTNVNNAYAQLVRNAANNSIGDLAEGLTSGDPEEVVRAMKAKRMLVPSEKWDYSSIIMPPRATSNLTQRYGLGGATQQYVARAIDSRRAEIIKQTGVEQENVAAEFDQTGKYVTFHVFGNDGLTHPSFPHGISMNLADLDKRVDKVKKDAEKRKNDFQGKTGMGILGTATIPKAPIGKLAVKVNGSPTTVQYTAAASIPFGGNAQLTKIMLDHWVDREGFVVNPTQSGTPSGGGQSSVSVMGLGTNMDVHRNASDGKGSTWGKRFGAAQGNPQAVMNVTSDFIAQHHKGLTDNLKAANIPVPTTAPYNRRYISSVMAIADAMWLSPSTGKYMVKVLKQPNLNAALSLFKQNNAMYTTQKSGALHPRTVAFMAMIKDHYRNM